MSKKRELTSEERGLWRRVASTVKTRKPLPHGEAEAASKSPPRRTVPHEAPTQRPSERPAATRPVQNVSAEKRVRRGNVEIGATLDLHGHTQDSALAALVRFLHRAQKRGDRAVIVVTGIGRGGEGVLKRMFPTWLATKEIQPIVAGYAQAHRSHGGAGAFYVFIKRRRE